MMAFLDSLVVTTTLPSLRLALHSSLASLEWTVNAYNLSFACLLLTGAALGDRFGRRRMLCTSLAIFVGASLLAGSAPTIGVLVAARVLQGASAAIMVPLTLTLVTGACPPGRRGWAIGIWGGAGGLSGAIGPFVGGAVVQAIGWHWIFWINQQRTARARRRFRRRRPGSAFSRPGVYSSAGTFVAGFRSALWVAVAFSAAGIPLALLRGRAAAPEPEPAAALGGTADEQETRA